MSIEKSDGEFFVNCDSCSNSDGLGVVKFMDAVSEAKSLGWKAHKGERGWVHICPCCQETDDDENIM
jgi:hypothetical protein